jgi:hypothetical protein
MRSGPTLSASLMMNIESVEPPVLGAHSDHDRNKRSVVACTIT